MTCRRHFVLQPDGPKVVRRLSLLSSLLLLVPAGAFAQLPRDTLNPTGMVGSAFAAFTHLSLDGTDVGRRGGGGIRIGFRARTSRSPGWDRLRYGVDVSVAVTDIQGMTPDKDPFAFSSFDFGPTVSARLLPRLRSYLYGRIGKQTIEHVDAGEVWNYAAGKATTLGFGLELPVTPEGRGLDFSVQSLRGRFGSRERLERLETGVDLPYRAWRLMLGWSGPMTIRAPWR